MNDLQLDRSRYQKALPPPPERRKIEESVRKQSAAFGEKLVEARRSVDAILAQYRELTRDTEVKQTMDAVRRATRSQALRLGPSDEFRRLVRELEADEKLLNAGAGGSKPRPPGRR